MIRLETTSDFRALLLIDELKINGIVARIDSKTNSGLSAGFGTTGLAQIYVLEADLEAAKVVLEAFRARMQEEEE